MKKTMLNAALVTLTLFAPAASARAQEDAEAQRKVQPKAGKANAAKAKAKAKARAEAAAKAIDINSATKEQLKTLPGITDAYADKIIAGRPYLSKAFLVTKNVLPNDLFQALRTRIVARQPGAKK